MPECGSREGGLTLKLVSIIGTRPNFTKEYAIHHICKEKGIKEITIHTGQHQDYEMSRIFFKELGLPRPDYINSIIKGTQGYETATMLAFIEQVLMQEKPNVVLVYGDVNSTIAGALAAVKLRIPVAHIEAGLRTPNAFYNPEEVNRRLTDACSELLFPHIKSAYESLMKEGYSEDRVYLYGDIVKDSLLRIMKEKNIKTKSEDFILCTIHRQENTDSAERMREIVEALIESGLRIKFPIHPRTRNALMDYDLMDMLKKCRRIELIPPLGYIEFIELLSSCRRFMTDSGSARREAYILCKPVIVPIDIVWVKEMIDCGWSRIALDKKEMKDALLHHNPDSKNRPEIFGDGHAAERIIEKIMERYR